LAEYFGITLDELFGRTPMSNGSIMRMRIPRGYTQETWQAHWQIIADRLGQQYLEKQYLEKQ